MSDSIIQAIPDLVAFVSRDGVITHHIGGRQLQGMPNLSALAGRRLDEAWPERIAQLLQQMLRRALATRAPVECRYDDGSRSYEARVRPQGRERVLCVIREIADAESAATKRNNDALSTPAVPSVERRGFLQRMKQSISEAALREQPLSLCMIHLGGFAAIGQTIDFTIADQVMTNALQRLPPCGDAVTSPALAWYVGQLGDGLLAVVVQGARDREAVRSAVKILCDSLAAPVTLGDASFCLTPCAGIAILGEDAAKPMALLEHARVALAEARRSGPGAVQFYSDTLRQLLIIRLDFERELREAIASEQIELRYLGRHDLATGRLAAIQAYLRWRHPLRGDVSPAEFLPIAASTGLATAVSRCALLRLQRDFPLLPQLRDPTVKLSFGPLRHHLVCDELLTDVEGLFRATGLEPGMIELRIAERTLASLGKAERIVNHVAGRGAKLVVDEFGRGFSSLAHIAQLPLHALQIDRKFALAISERPSALRFCRGAIALARSYGLIPIAAGIDNDSIRQQFLELGCEQGLGDCFEPIELPAPSAATAGAETAIRLPARA